MSFDASGDPSCRALLRAPDEGADAYHSRIQRASAAAIGTAVRSDDAQCAHNFAGCLASLEGAPAAWGRCAARGRARAGRRRAGFAAAQRGEQLADASHAAKRGFVAARLRAPGSVHDALRVPAVADALY